MRTIALSAAMILMATAAHAEWSYAARQDSTTAYASYGRVGAMIRCIDGRLEAFVDFDEFLSNRSVSVAWKTDNSDERTGRWYPSSDGTALFVDEQADFARALIAGNRVTIEPTGGDRVTLDLSGSGTAIRRVLSDCGFPEVSRENLEGVDKHIALEVERWGPKSTRAYKEVLADAGFYDGDIDGEQDDALFVAATAFYNDYIERCRDGESLGLSCDILQRSLRARISNPPMPLLRRALYETAGGSLQGQLAELSAEE
jgi:hypothetical protein